MSFGILRFFIFIPRVRLILMFYFDRERETSAQRLYHVTVFHQTNVAVQSRHVTVLNLSGGTG